MRLQDGQHVFALTASQREIYYEQLLHPETSIFNVGAAVTIDGPFEPELFTRAVRHVYHIHPELNATIFEEDGRPLQRLAPRDDFVPSVADFSRHAQPEHEARRFMAEHFQEPLPFGAQSPLSTITLFVINPQRHIWYTKFHHIISDGWSLSLLFQKLVEQYNRLKKGEPDLSPDEFRFEKFIAAEQQYAASEAALKDRRYWEEKFVTSPPSCYPPRKPFAYESAHRVLVIPREKFERIITLARQENCTSFHFITAALFSCLAQAHRTYDLSIALPILNRPSRAFKETMGLFVNVLPLRLEVDPDGSFRTLLGQVAHQLARDYRRGRYAVGRLLRKRQTASSGRQHLNEVSFSYERHFYDRDFEGCRNRVTPLVTRQQVRPLQIFLREYDKRDDVYLDFDYNLSFIDEGQMQEFVVRLDELIDRGLSNPSATVCAPKYTAAEEPKTPPQVRLHDEAMDLVTWFEDTTRRHLDRVALSHGTTHLTYTQLNARANRLARLLRSRGLAPESLLALCLDRSSDILVCLLAALKAGAAYLPLDPAYPQHRLCFLLSDAAPTLLIADRRSASVLPASTVPTLLLDELGDELDTFSTDDLSLPINADQAAYVIYTSGSTGTPKGCVVTHANVCGLMSGTAADFAFSASDVWTLFHSYAFDFSVWELWGALLHGGRLVVVPYLTSREPERFYELLRDEGVTVLNQTPSAFRQLMAHEESRGGKADELSLRYVIFGGEALDPSCLRGWIERHGDEHPQLVNMYGITETTVHVTRRRIVAEDVARAAGSPIGEALAGVRAYVLDGRMREAPDGVRGELYVGGSGVARGYLNRSALTAERFVPDALSGERGARLYRSGDMARRRGDGGLEYVGRSDTQVKVRGFRIELAEIEAAICEHEAVSVAVALTVGNESAEKRLVCYVSRRGGVAPVGVAELRRHLQARLPEYMVPAALMFVERLPLTEHGKVDRRALAEMEWSGEAQEESYVGARNAREEALVEVWEEVLGLERVGIEDDFFGLGGDSILALQVVAKARRRGLEINFKDIYERPTICLLVAPSAGPLAENAAPGMSSPLVGLNETDLTRLPFDVEDAFPLSSLQTGMLYHSELSPQSAIFHDIFSFQLEVEWDERSWRQALAQLAQAHPSLRTSFALGSYSEALQLVHRSATIPCDVTDLRGRPAEEQRLEVGLWTEREKENGFTFEQAPLLRVQVHLLDERRIQFTVSFHHAVLDGWSVATLVTQLLSVYTRRRELTAARPANDFRAFVYAEREALADEALGRFWLEQLKSMPLTRLASARRDSERGPIRRHGVAISEELSEKLSRLSQHCAVPLKTVLLAAHLRVISALSGLEHATTGYVTHSRPESDEVETLGLFLNTLPFSAPEAEGSWIEFVRRVFLKEKELLPGRGYPLAGIKQLNRRQLPFDVGFNYVQFHVYQALRDNERLKILDFEIYEETDFGLLAQFTRHPFSLTLGLTLAYDSHSFTAAQVTEFGNSYAEVLKAMTDQPQAQVRARVSRPNGNGAHANGERYALPAPDFANPDVPFVAPTNETQEKLALLYEEVLNVQPVGIRHSFFELGGNSILATRLISRIRHLFRTDLPLNVLFENPDIERLSAFVNAPAQPTQLPPTISPARRKLSTVKVSDGQ